MKKVILVLILAGGASLAADRELGQLPDGQYYIKDEVLFCLKADAARALSPASTSRRRVDASSLTALHRAIAEVRGNHRSAANWLAGVALPKAVRQVGDECPSSPVP